MNKIEIMMGEDVELLFRLDTLKLKEYLDFVLENSGICESTVNVIFVNNKIMSSLNKNYKKREGTTDVLSFDLSEEGELTGEIYICADKAAEQAEEYGVDQEEEIVRLATHGMLHLAGRVHDTEDELVRFTEETEKLIKKYPESGYKE